MLTVLKWLFYLIAAIAIIIVGGSFLLPAQAVVTRSTEIAAPPDKVFAIVGDLRRFNEFSPWADLDPNIKYTFEGPESGVGQKMNWTSDNADVGSGSQTITKYEPPNFRGIATRFRHARQAGRELGSRAVDSGHQRHMGLQVRPRRHPGKMVRPDVRPLDRRRLRKGLAKLKAVAEKPAPEPATPEHRSAGSLRQPEPATPEPTAPATPAPEPPAEPADARAFCTGTAGTVARGAHAALAPRRSASGKVAQTFGNSCLNRSISQLAAGPGGESAR